MKNIKVLYWILASSFIIVTFLVTFFLVGNRDNQAAVFLSGLAIVFAIIAMGLSDKNIPSFKGQVELWTTDEFKNLDEEGGHEFKLSIRIENYSTVPINDIIFKFRTPSKISSNYDQKNQNVKLLKHGRTFIFIDKTFGILGPSIENDYLHYDFKIKYNLWKRDNFYITLNGSNIKTKHWCVAYEEKLNIKDATSVKKLRLN